MGRGENYFLVLEGKNGTKYRVFNTPITLKEIDGRTTKYSGKRELISTILGHTKKKIKPEDIKEVSIYMISKRNGEEEYKKEKGPLYKKDAGVLNEESVLSKFELMLFDRNFVREYVKKYKSIEQFRGLCKEVERDLNDSKRGNYFEPLELLTEKTLSTYKGVRNAYLSIKKYENSKKTYVRRESIEPEYDSDEFSIEQDRLRYLIEHEPELLDIDDFVHNEDMSPFDAHKSR